MRRSSSRAAVLLGPGLLLALSAAVTPPSPGVVFRMETTLHTDSGPLVDTIELRIEERMIAVPEAELGTGMIFRGDGDKARMYAIDHLGEAFMVLDAATVERMAVQMEAAMSQVEALLGAMDPEEREAFEQAREEAGIGPLPGDDPLPPVEIRETDERDEIQGFPVRRYDVYRGERRVREIWSTPWSEIRGGDEAAAAFESMSAFFDDVMDRVPESMAGGEGFENPWAEIDLDSGFPVLSREFGEDGTVERESALIANSIATLDPADFEPPAGYSEVDLGVGPGD